VKDCLDGIGKETTLSGIGVGWPGGLYDAIDGRGLFGVTGGYLLGL
jgi:hypothetical protein